MDTGTDIKGLFPHMNDTSVEVIQDWGSLLEEYKQSVARLYGIEGRRMGDVPTLSAKEKQKRKAKRKQVKKSRKINRR